MAPHRRLRLQPRHVLGPQIDRTRQILDDDGELPVVVLERAAWSMPSSQPRIQRLDPLGPSRQRLHEHTRRSFRSRSRRTKPARSSRSITAVMAPVVRPGVDGQPAGGRRARQIQQVEALQVGRVQTDQPADGVADQDRLRADLRSAPSRAVSSSAVRDVTHTISLLQVSCAIEISFAADRQR